ncbi:unnamed protein product [Blepharisma stoltei]|uniref:Dynein light chain n=1 Tax=Blepharisma stoltei TaxID=1481888 RepID=A0AAU9IDX7_9CILI|nr:unnamed protein product [Blepharisma stoltei]
MQQESFSALKNDVNSRAQQTINGLLGNKEYNQEEVPQWTAHLSEEIVKSLKELSSNFKYCVSCVILQKGDAGMHMSSTCFWDSNLDGSVAIKWENNSMHCIVNIYGIAF